MNESHRIAGKSIAALGFYINFPNESAKSSGGLLYQDGISKL